MAWGRGQDGTGGASEWAWPGAGTWRKGVAKDQSGWRAWLGLWEERRGWVGPPATGVGGVGAPLRARGATLASSAHDAPGVLPLAGRGALPRKDRFL